jgi:hypothetical protein
MTTSTGHTSAQQSISNHFMLKHLTQNRTSDKFRGFSYRKVLKDSSGKHGYISKVIAWDVFESDKKLTTLDTLKEVKYYIQTLANK